MTDMIERAAKAIWTAQGWAANSPWEKRRDVMKDETRAEARAALLAALDPEDEALVEFLARDKCNREHNSAYVWDGGGLSKDIQDYWRAEAQATLRALHFKATAQGER